MFDLFKLHSEKDRPSGWIWVYFDCNLLKKHYKLLLKKNNQNQIAKIISQKLNCGFSTIGKHLIKIKYGKNKIYFPLPVIIELVILVEANIKEEIIKLFQNFRIYTDTTSKITNPVRNISNLLAKVIGSHLADGSLSNNYHLVLCDNRKELVKAYKSWINDLFNVEGKVRFDKKQNMYTYSLGNKIIGRYFEKIFDIKVGRKFDVACEPKIIKKSSLSIRKEFAKGVLNFDGGVKSTGMVALTSMSKALIDDVSEILRLDGIEVNKRYNKNKKSWLIESKSGRNKEYIAKLLVYFEEGTWKYKRLKFFLNKRKYKIEELTYLFPTHHLSKINLTYLYKILSKMEKFKINDIMKKLKENKIKINNVTAYKYLFILEKAGLIYKKLENHIGPKNGWQETVYYLN
jgi:predicted transcriptional regulator